MPFAFPRGFDIDGTTASSFPRMSFKGIEFPYTNLSVKCGIRYAQHEFPHAPGAEIEKMGRKAYIINVVGMFHAIPGSELDKQYPGLYPGRLRELRDLFEKETTDNLVVPTIGTMKVVATAWQQDFNVQVGTGENVALEFVEDQESNAFVDLGLDISMAKMAEANTDLLSKVALMESKRAATQSVMQDINDAVTAVQAVGGMADAMSQMVAGKIAAIAQLCQYADGQLEDMQDPLNHLVVEALKNLWASAQDLAANIVETREQLMLYKVPKLMSIGQVAMAIYGTTEKTEHLLKLNTFSDALAIPPATDVVYSK